MADRNAVAFFLLGLLNNLTFVVNNAGAMDILPSDVGVIYLLNSVPELIVKVSAPFWWHAVSYDAKVACAGILFGVSMVLVHGGLGASLGVRLLGVACASFGVGLGECTMLALSQRFASPKAQISAWSSGTGAAGVGFLVVSSPVPACIWCMYMVHVYGACIWCMYRCLLAPPADSY